MKGSLKHLIEAKTPFGTFARYRRKKRLYKKFHAWEKAGSVLPLPHLGKQLVIQKYIQKFLPPIFIETGTYKGDMVYAMQPHFEDIYSIELDEDLFRKARKKLARFRNVHIIHGQSGEFIPNLLQKIDKPCLFWLDAHYSGGKTAKGSLETPIIQELDCILKHQHAANHVILIDDAREFTGQNDYPTIEFLKEYIKKSHPKWVFKVEDDIIRTHSDKYRVSAEPLR